MDLELLRRNIYGLVCENVNRIGKLRRKGAPWMCMAPSHGLVAKAKSKGKKKVR